MGVVSFHVLEELELYPYQLMEIALGKVAKATGKQIRIPQLPPPEGWYRWTKAQMDAAGVPEASDVFDPATGRTIKNVGDGYMYTMAFHHLAEKKASARGADGAFTQDEQPAKGGYEGAKRASGMDLWGMLAHNVPDVIKDFQIVKGTRNDDYWRALQLGLPTPEPDTPFIYKKFLNTLRAGGVNVTEKGSITSIMPQTDKDVERMAGGRVISSSEMVDPDFEPVKGGLFDLGKTGGMSGNQWSMIELPEPVPNPIMEEPVRRLLGLTTSKMEDILAGREKLDGKTGGEALKDALSKIDVDKRIEESKRGVTTLRGQKRDDAVKVYRYLTAMKKQGLKPQDWMISKVPVIPPAFRPVSKMGDVALTSDLNKLYKDVIESANLFRDLKKDMSDDGLADERLDIYNSVKAAYGLGQPITPENAAKGVKGAIRQVIGSRPKWGQFQGKVISKPVGNVARGVTVADPNYDMDTIGMPEKMAWDVFKPYVVRNLSQHGYPMQTVLKMIEDKTPTARHILEEEMEKRPVIMDRAPTWHKFNFMAFRPKLVDGDKIVVSPLVDPSFNMDHDGDAQLGSVVICLKNKDFMKLGETVGKSSCKSCKTLVDFAVSKGHRSTAMTTNTKTAIKHNYATSIVDLSEFPHGKLSSVTKRDGFDIEFYEVPKGVKVASYNESTGQVEFKDVAYWSVHKGKEIELVNLHGGHQIITDNDPRAVYGVAKDSASLAPARFTPSEAIAKRVLVPVVNDILSSPFEGMYYSFDTGLVLDRKTEHSFKLDFEFGQFVGMLAGDGWSDSNNVVFLADNEGFNIDELFRMVRTVYPDSHVMAYSQKKETDSSRYGDTVRYRVSVGTSSFGRCVKDLVGGNRDERTSGSANKRLPVWYQFAGRDFILGLVNGLVATDGTVALSYGKGKPQLQVAVSSTSIRLVREFKRCLQLLGVKSTISFSKKTTAGNTSWICSASSIDAKAIGLLDNCCNRRKRDIFVSATVESGEMFVKNDIVPFPSGISEAIVKYVPASKTYKMQGRVSDEELKRRRYYMTTAISVRRAADNGFITRNYVEKLVEFGKMLADKNEAVYTAGMSVLSRLDSGFSKYVGSKESRRTWKVAATVDDANSIAAAAQAAKPRIVEKWDKQIHPIHTVLTLIRKKGYATRSNVDDLLAFFKKFNRPNSDLRDCVELKELVRVAKSNVQWVKIDSVEKTGKVETLYDLTVPGSDTFLSDDGIILSNTVNLHVPSSMKAVQQAYGKMLPSENLTMLTDLRTPMYQPGKEQIFGLYALTKEMTDKPVKVFNTVSEAKQAYARGEIGPNDPIEVLHR